MSKYFFIIRDDEDGPTEVVTRCGLIKYAQEFIVKMGTDNYIIWPTNEDKNHYALEEYLQNKDKAIMPITKKEGESKMDNAKLINAIALTIQGLQKISNALSGQEETKIEDAPKDEPKKEKKTKSTKKEEPRVEEPTVQEDDFSDFEFEAEEEKVKYTVEDIRAACIAHAKKNTKEKTYAILKEFGAKSPNDIKAESYNDVMAKLAV